MTDTLKYDSNLARDFLTALGRDVQGTPQEISREVKSILSSDNLTLREREVLELRYGLRYGINYTLGEVGQIYKVTPERVRQLEARAIMKLNRPVRE